MFLYTRLLEAFPRLKQLAFRSLYQYLGRHHQHADWTFMNYGYAGHHWECPPLLPEDQTDRYSIQLYEKVTSGVTLRGRRLLEVGSGRGGGLSYLHRYRGPSVSRGVDISAQQVAWCNDRHRAAGEGLWFVEGDALSLPFNDKEFDVVINVESSHCYPSRAAFFREVHRVLRPGGAFCFADLHEKRELDGISNALHQAGFVTWRCANITAGVVKALELDDERKGRLIAERSPGWLRRPFSCFAGQVGSRTYRSFVCGARQYTLWHLVKIP